MTEKQALKKAQKMWGDDAMVRSYKHGGEIICRIGRITFGCMFDVKAQGATFEQAFEQAERLNPKLNLS